MQAAVIKAPYLDGGTPTGYAMEKAREAFVAKMRPNVQKVK